jgi:hypothetical protein
MFEEEEKSAAWKKKIDHSPHFIRSSHPMNTSETMFVFCT